MSSTCLISGVDALTVIICCESTLLKYKKKIKINFIFHKFLSSLIVF